MYNANTPFGKQTHHTRHIGGHYKKQNEKLMLKFFQRVRRKFINEGNLRRYLIYAVGEIILVMIGILLALQVNNWNEGRKDKKKEILYLSEIKSDLQNDLLRISRRDTIYSYRLAIFKLIEKEFYTGQILKVKIDTNNIKIHEYFIRPNHLRATIGAYHALMANGDSEIFSNQELFTQIQSIYEWDFQSLISIYEEMKEMEGRVNWKYSYEFNDLDFTALKNSSNAKTRADLSVFYRQIFSFHRNMKKLEKNILTLLSQINLELNK